jgi:hypothetical protein
VAVDRVDRDHATRPQDRRGVLPNDPGEGHFPRGELDALRNDAGAGNATDVPVSVQLKAPHHGVSIADGFGVGYRGFGLSGILEIFEEKGGRVFGVWGGRVAETSRLSERPRRRARRGIPLFSGSRSPLPLFPGRVTRVSAFLSLHLCVVVSSRLEARRLVTCRSAHDVPGYPVAPVTHDAPVCHPVLVRRPWLPGTRLPCLRAFCHPCHASHRWQRWGRWEAGGTVAGNVLPRGARLRREALEASISEAVVVCRPQKAISPLALSHMHPRKLPSSSCGVLASYPRTPASRRNLPTETLRLH